MAELQVEVAYAEPRQQFLRTVILASGACVREAIEVSGVLAEFPNIDPRRQRVGIWSRVVALDTLLRNGDRVEIYRDLIADPKQVRRERAKR